jgi:hypothetical protein
MKTNQITIKFEIKLHHLEWAAYMISRGDTKLTKTAVRNYLKKQIELFGIDDDSLMGERHRAIFVDHQCSSYDEIAIELIRRWVKSNFKEMERRAKK